MRDTRRNLSPTTIFLHWLVGIVMIGMVGSGIYMSSGEDKIYSLYPIHKSIGVLIVFFALIRIYWRVVNGWIQAESNNHPFLHFISKVVQWVLIIATVLMPISGAMLSAMGGFGIEVFGYELFAANYVDGKAVALNETLAGFAREMHEIGGNVLLIAIGLHILGALKHHYINRDETLSRMLGRSKSGNIF